MVFVSCRPLELGCFIQARGDAGDLGDVLHSLAPGMFSPVPLRQSLGTILARQGLRDGGTAVVTFRVADEMAVYSMPPDLSEP